MNDEPFAGVRGFRLSPNARLCSLFLPTFWDQAEVGPAVCYRQPEGQTPGPWFACPDSSVPPHDAPREGCRCGFGGYHPGALEHSVAHLDESDIQALVIGYGKVWPGSKAWHAEFARIVAILTPKLLTLADRINSRVLPGPDALRAVADRYGVPLVPREHVKRIAPEFGQVLPFVPDPPQRQFK